MEIDSLAETIYLIVKGKERDKYRAALTLIASGDCPYDSPELRPE